MITREKLAAMGDMDLDLQLEERRFAAFKWDEEFSRSSGSELSMFDEVQAWLEDEGLPLFADEAEMQRAIAEQRTFVIELAGPEYRRMYKIALSLRILSQRAATPSEVALAWYRAGLGDHSPDAVKRILPNISTCHREYILDEGWTSDVAS
jgi:hypothetical protein